MAIMRWEPFREIESLQRQMNRLFDQMAFSGDREPTGEMMSFVPAAEIHETDNEIKLRMEVPGMEANDLDVKVSQEAVSISGERKSETSHDDKGMRRSEFRYGRFQRVIPLPAQIQNDKVEAEFKNGVLCLTLPKAESAKQKVVTVNLGGQDQSQKQIAPDRESSGEQPSEMGQQTIANPPNEQKAMPLG